MTDKIYNQYSILLVDDHSTMLQITKTLLVQIGFSDIEKASDGLQAIEQMKNKRFDLIISDWNMPNMSGLELLKYARASENLQIKSVPFILVTAESKSENIIQAKAAGVNNYIVKPFSIVVLKQKIDATLGIF